jgi:hypothetical protein
MPWPWEQLLKMASHTRRDYFFSPSLELGKGKSGHEGVALRDIDWIGTWKGILREALVFIPGSTSWARVGDWRTLHYMIGFQGYSDPE